jgi:hypothetical protein
MHQGRRGRMRTGVLLVYSLSISKGQDISVNVEPLGQELEERPIGLFVHLCSYWEIIFHS